MPMPPVTKIRDEYGLLKVKLTATDDELKELQHDLVIDCYNITDDMQSAIMQSLSPVGWMSASDVAFDTDIDRLDVARALTVMDGVLRKGPKASMLYRRKL